MKNRKVDEELADDLKITAEDGVQAEEDDRDTTLDAGSGNLTANMRGKPTGRDADDHEAPEGSDTGGGITGGGGNEGALLGEDGVTEIGDADPDIADQVINADTDGSQAGQVGHPGIDEGTE